MHDHLLILFFFKLCFVSCISSTPFTTPRQRIQANQDRDGARPHCSVSRAFRHHTSVVMPFEIEWNSTIHVFIK